MLTPILHAGGFNWDEALVLIVAILAVPALSWFTGRWGQRRRDAAARAEQRRVEREQRRSARRE